MKMQIPYQKQIDPQKCGAASLCMIYDGHGQRLSQEDVWTNISSESWCARSHLMASDALDRGFHAMTVRGRHRWQSLVACQAYDIPAIINHRFTEQSSRGHFSVFLSTLGERALFHDPFHGPGRSLTRPEVDQLWRWMPISPEVAGNILIPVSKETRQIDRCDECGKPLPSQMTCPSCGAEIPLTLNRLLGCGDPTCKGRLWSAIFCPRCDQRLIGFEGETDDGAAVDAKSRIRQLTDMVKERVLMAADAVPDERSRQALQSMADECDKIGPQLEDEFKSMKQSLTDSMKSVHGLDQKRDDAATKAAAKKSASLAKLAKIKEDQQKRQAKRNAPPSLDDEQLRLDLLRRFGLPSLVEEAP